MYLHFFVAVSHTQGARVRDPREVSTLGKHWKGARLPIHGERTSRAVVVQSWGIFHYERAEQEQETTAAAGEKLNKINNWNEHNHN